MQDDTQVVVPTTEGEVPVVVETTEGNPEVVVAPEEVIETPAV